MLKVRVYLKIWMIIGLFAAVSIACGAQSGLSEVEIRQTVEAEVMQTQAAQSPPDAEPGLPDVDPAPPEPASPDAGPDEPAPPLTPTIDPHPPLSLPFRDNFDQGLDPTWRIINGRPLIDKGKLTAASGELALEIGNSSLTNYTLELDIIGEQEGRCGRWGRSLTIGLAPGLQYKYTQRGSGTGVWLTYDGGRWTEISRQAGLDCGRFRFEIAGSAYKVFINGQLSGDLIFEPAQGPLLLKIEQGIFINNLEIR